MVRYGNLRRTTANSILNNAELFTVSIGNDQIIYKSKKPNIPKDLMIRPFIRARLLNKNSVFLIG